MGHCQPAARASAQGGACPGSRSGQPGRHRGCPWPRNRGPRVRHTPSVRTPGRRGRCSAAARSRVFTGGRGQYRPCHSRAPAKCGAQAGAGGRCVCGQPVYLGRAPAGMQRPAFHGRAFAPHCAAAHAADAGRARGSRRRAHRYGGRHDAGRKTPAGGDAQGHRRHHPPGRDVAGAGHQ